MCGVRVHAVPTSFRAPLIAGAPLDALGAGARAEALRGVAAAAPAGRRGGAGRMVRALGLHGRISGLLQEELDLGQWFRAMPPHLPSSAAAVPDPIDDHRTCRRLVAAPLAMPLGAFGFAQRGRALRWVVKEAVVCRTASVQVSGQRAVAPGRLRGCADLLRGCVGAGGRLECLCRWLHLRLRRRWGLARPLDDGGRAARSPGQLELARHF
mmetsp:Transcript_90525/g.230271  ORF Transcript_90525/g.230271 Transcript_90525/m.230271 type:complete len:211 (-) Transcript_90525:1300-1932(-)